MDFPKTKELGDPKKMEGILSLSKFSNLKNMNIKIEQR